jgi:LmbE family N-acetylglucosaminyl deacetylase
MNILGVGAHPDDIEFGCGGTLLKYVAKGDNVFYLVLTKGMLGGDAVIRASEQEKAARFLGAKGVFWGDFEDTKVVDTHETITKIESVVRRVSPEVVFLNYYDDVHQDHRAAALAGISATRYIKEVLFYEVPTTQHFEPDIFVNIRDVLKKKLQLLTKHASQVDKTRVKNLTILESAKSCAYFRGFQGRVKFAEGFKALRVLRHI